MEGISDKALKNINKAQELSKEAMILLDKSYDLTEGYVFEVMKIIDNASELSLEKINEYLFILPSSFYRVELRTYYNKKFKNMK